MSKAPYPVWDGAYHGAKEGGKSDADAAKAAEGEADSKAKVVSSTEDGPHGAADMENDIREEVGVGERPRWDSDKPGDPLDMPKKK